MSGPIAILCSGQGTQHAGMFDLVAQASEAQPVLEAAREVLGGKDPRRFVREADAATLFSNRSGQILCCTQALAAWAIVRPHLPGSVVLAGYSVGELAAWGCAGLLEPREVLRLAVTRAEVMDEAGGSGTGLEAFIGLSRARVEELCRPHAAHSRHRERGRFLHRWRYEGGVADHARRSEPGRCHLRDDPAGSGGFAHPLAGGSKPAIWRNACSSALARTSSALEFVC